MAWDVEVTDEFCDWYDSLEDEFQVDAVDEGVARLETDGPTLGRPLVDRVHQSGYHNMKELRPLGNSLRILFIFDPRRTAILLLGGDKEGEWDVWYDEHVPVADALYEQYLRELEEEGLIS